MLSGSYVFSSRSSKRELPNGRVRSRDVMRTARAKGGAGCEPRGREGGGNAEAPPRR